MKKSRTTKSTRGQTRGAGGWLTTLLIAVVLIGGALGWRVMQDQYHVQLLPRTRALIAQKTGSLEAYNLAVSETELVEFFNQHVDGHAVTAETFTSMTDLVMGDILPMLWRDSQQESSDSRFISHRAMASVIGKHFPRRVLTNADVILFPQHRDLRIVVAEAPQDHFRDSGWHWRWIGQYLEGLSPNELRGLKELDIYAAEELSEFLSVLGVALIDLAARDVDKLAERPRTPADVAINARSIRKTYERIKQRTKASLTSFAKRDSRVATRFSDQTKRRLAAALPQPMFRDVTQSVGIDFRHVPNRRLWLRRSDLEVPLGIAGGGVASGDFDGDGHLDLYFAGDQGGRLYRNVLGTHFEDASSAAGLRLEGESRAGYFIDYDNDGDLDLYVTFVWQSNRLYENDGSGVFQEITDQVGLTSSKTVTHEAIWFDMDNDGLLDLYTANFGTWTEGAVPTLGRINANAPPNLLYHHRLEEGRHQFVEVAEEMGVDDRGWTHCVGAWDFDQDGYLDLFSLNDFGASLAYRNLQGEGKGFLEVSRDLHLDAVYNAMNFTLMDITHDGQPSIYISQVMKLTHRQRYRKPTEKTAVVFTAKNLENLRTLVTNRLFCQRSETGTYEDLHDACLEPAELGWAWDASALDYENDGDLDLLVLNGTESNIPTEDGASKRYLSGRLFLKAHAEQQNVMYVSEGGYFYDVSQDCPLAYKGNSRGSTFFDYDADGDLDVAINDYNGPARIFENLQNSNHHWVRFQLEGTRSNRDAVGARVEIRFGDQVRYDQVVSGSGFLSQNPTVLHFGLGGADQVDQLLITWPSGAKQGRTDLSVDQTHKIVEPVVP